MKRGSYALPLLLVIAGCHKAPKPPSVQPTAQAAGPVAKGCAPENGSIEPTKEQTRPAIADSEPDCSFYRAAYHEFLYATLPQTGSPAFLLKPYSTVADLFGGSATPLVPTQRSNLLSLTPRTPEQPHSAALDETVLGSGIRQAGRLQGILIDRNGRPIFYSIHVNDRFAAFLRDAKHPLHTPDQLAHADKNLKFDGDVVEMKAAWMILDKGMSPSDYLTTQAVVPNLRQDTSGNISLDTSKTTQVTVALIALHVAFTRPNHPEMIWASFEHVDKNGVPDLSPSAKQNPTDSGSVTLVNPDKPYLLFAKGSTAAQANNGIKKLTFDGGTQTFAGSTPIYRIYPHSKVGAGSDEEDDAVVSLNGNVRNAFEIAKRTADPRYHYRLVGAVWLKHPDGTPGHPEVGFGVPRQFANGDIQSSDDPNAVLSGEAAMSSMAIESFTQRTFPNCFGCHDTQAIVSDAKPHPQLIDEKMINVSHVMSKFLAEQAAAPPVPK